MLTEHMKLKLLSLELTADHLHNQREAFRLRGEKAKAEMKDLLAKGLPHYHWELRRLDCEFLLSQGMIGMADEAIAFLSERQTEAVTIAAAALQKAKAGA